MRDELCSLEHPILFVFDHSEPEVSIPEYSPSSVTAANAGCVSVRVASYLDGDVRVRLALANEVVESDLRELICVFDGSVLVPSRVLSVVTSLNEKVASMSVDDRDTRLKIFVDEIALPTSVLVLAF